MRKFTSGRALVAATETTLFVVPVGMNADVHLIHMANNGTPTTEGSVYWTDSSQSTDIYFFNAYSFAKGEAKSYNNIEFVLEEGDSLKAISEAGSTMSVIVTFDLYPKIGTVNNITSGT